MKRGKISSSLLALAASISMLAAISGGSAVAQTKTTTAVPTATLHRAGTSAQPATATYTAVAPKPYQVAGSPPQVEFDGNSYCNPTGCAVLVVLDIFGYVDGTAVGGHENICVNSSGSCSVAHLITKQWGCHNYQGYATASFKDQNGDYHTDSGWSSIWQGCR